MSLLKLNGAPTPPRRLLIQPSANSPFCTTPSQLQEVTLDPDATNFSYMGLRSPGALTCGRSVKEIDEQLTNLKKENFNLKLRIYFLEERMGSNFCKDKEDALKNNIELMVELENVRKELQDKHELVCQAAKAMEIEDEEKKKELNARDEEIKNLKELLKNATAQLENEKQGVKQMALCVEAFNLNLEEGSAATEVITKLQNTIKELGEELKKERERADHFENIMGLAECVREKCRTLEYEVKEKDDKLDNLSSDMIENDLKISEFTKRIEELEKELYSKSIEIDNIKADALQKDNLLEDLQLQLNSMKKLYEVTLEQKDRTDKKIQKYKTLLEQSENKISELTAYNDALKSKNKNYEMRLNDENIKKTSRIESISSTDQNNQSNNVDNTSFSVRNSSAVSDKTPKSSPLKNVSQVNRSSKSNRPTSPSVLKSPTRLSNISSSNSNETGENIPQKIKSFSDIPSEKQFTPDELLELKKDHYKACKLIKVLIQAKKESREDMKKLQTKINERENEIGFLKNKVTELETCTQKTCNNLRKKSIKEKVSELNLTASLNPSVNKEQSMVKEEMDLAEQYKQLADELETKIEILNATIFEKDAQLERLKCDIQAKANRIIDLEFELLTFAQGLDSSHDSTEDTTEKLMQDKIEKEQKIEKLESELRQRTCDLQSIVNKELWEKNRSIEKMQIILKSKDQAIDKLEESVDSKELQLQTLKDKINELGNQVNQKEQNRGDSFEYDSTDDRKLYLEERKHFVRTIEELQSKLKNIPERDHNNPLTELQLAYNDLSDELEKSEKLRLENQEVCSILSTRLEELCHFLDSLLKHRSVLGFLGTEQTKKLQDVLNRSMELSQTLSTTISLNPDQSLLQLSNITNLLNSTRWENLSELIAHDEENNSVLSIIPSEITLTYQSHLNRTCHLGNDQTEVIKVLREQVADLKREIEVRDLELGKNLNNELVENDDEFVDALINLELKDMAEVNTPKTILGNLLNTEKSKLNVNEKSPNNNTTSTTLKNQDLENQSESESWSEPDRTVSLARIGLGDDSLGRPSLNSSKRSRYAIELHLSTGSTEEEPTNNSSKGSSKRTTLAESRQTVICLHEQVCELELKLKEKENQLLAAQVAYYEADNSLKHQQARLEEIRRENIKLNAQIAEVTEKLEEAEKIKIEHTELLVYIKEKNQELEQAMQQKEESEQKINELQKVVNVLEEFKRNAEVTRDLNNKQMQNTLNEMEVEKSKAIEASRNAEKVLEKAKKDMQLAEGELKNMYEREHKLRQELEITFKDNIKKVEEEYLSKIKNIQDEYEKEANKCKESINEIKETYEKEYVKRTIMDALTKETEKLKFTLQDYGGKLRSMNERETELKNKVTQLQCDHQNKLSGLYKELDNATLQYSEAILEKTKLKNEVTSLQNQIQKSFNKETELTKQITNLHVEYQKTKEELDDQITQLQHEKSVLELQLSELQHADFTRTRLTRNSGKLFSTSLPIYPEIYNSRTTLPIPTPYRRQLSDQSGYTSEDLPVDDGDHKNILSFVNSHMQNLLETMETDNERIQANSSPDLGIESDHGRFSSLEANVTIPRPLLPSLELAESMNNLLEPVQDIICSNEDCCKKTKQISNENVDLRKRLLRTRRALEDTLTRLTLANKQKKEVEKSICKQIHKTSQVLRKAKANLDSGSESDLLKK